jgi:glycerol-3-phosphate dehydrogenase
MLNKGEALLKEPLLPEEGLNGAGYYAEYRTDDSRLTIEIIKTSLNYGAKAFNYMRAESFLYNSQGKVCGVKIMDLQSGQTMEVEADNTINAAGPWVDQLRTRDGSRKGKKLHLTKGVHLVFPHHKLPVKQSVYFDVPDGRMIFAIPRGRVTYVGTTDTDFDGDPDTVQTELTDAVYLIAAVNHMFPSINLQLEDIESSWAGLRPLIHEEGKSASELSRKDELFVSESGLISIAGGKLTGYRKMAERAVNQVTKGMSEKGMTPKPCQTDKIPLCGNQFKNFKAVKKYAAQIAERLQPIGVSAEKVWSLVTTYGAQTDEVLAEMDPKAEDVQWQLLKAELEFTLKHEMVTCPADFFIRRTGKLYFDIEAVRKYLKPVISLLQEKLDIETALAHQWENELQSEISLHSDFNPDRYTG